MDLNIGSLQELADDLRIKHEKGKITEEEWSHWTHEISNDVYALQLRTPARNSK
jgi:hypothetical protein